MRRRIFNPGYDYGMYKDGIYKKTIIGIMPGVERERSNTKIAIDNKNRNRP